MGIAILLTAGTGLAFFFGKPYVQPSAPLLPVIPFGLVSRMPRQVRNALAVSPLLILGLLAAFAMGWMFRATRLGLRVEDRRRKPGRGAGARPAGQPHAAAGHRLRQRAGAGSAAPCLAGLSGQLERGAVLRPGADGGGAGGLRPLEPGALHQRGAAVRRRRRARAFACKPWASPGATTCSTPRPMR
jgi:hypothetical protein